MTSIPRFFVERWEQEQPAFQKVLRALPEGKLDYKPHERSTSAGDLAWQLALEQEQLSDLLEKGEIRFEMKPRPSSAADIAAAYEAATAKLRVKLESLDDGVAAKPANFYMGGEAPVWTDSTGGMLWGYLFDMVHHRGQLSTYLRPMGGKVPAIYGPSADDQGA